MATAKPAPKRTAKPFKAKRHVVHLAEIAWRELGLSTMTHADTERYWRIRRGMEWLDEEIGRVKGTLQGLLHAYDVRKEGDQLLAGLKELCKVIDPEKEVEFEKTVLRLSFGDALTLISGKMEDVEDFDEDKIENLLELLTGQPVEVTSRNPRLPLRSKALPGLPR
jgi:hypothetical protein